MSDHVIRHGGRRHGPPSSRARLRTPAAARPPRDLAMTPGHLALGGGAALMLIAPSLVHQLRYVPLIASLAVCGLPHGAADHLVPGWVRGRRSSPRELAAIVGGYLALTAAGVGLWLVAPLAALALFLAVTVYHWGSAELVWFSGESRRAWFAAARGAVPVLLPAVAFPGAVDRALRALLAPFLTHSPHLLLAGAARGTALGGIAVACLLGAGRGRRARLELAGLVGFFLLVDPVFAVGLYFIAWHAWRHIVRLAMVDPRAAAALARGEEATAILRVLRAALPCTVLALAGVLGFGLALAVHLGAAAPFTAVALALIAALTVPHAGVVAWLDRRAPGPAALG